MYIANTKIEVANKSFEKGQTVTGLSSFSADWLKSNGLVEEVADKVAEPTKEAKNKKTEKATEETAEKKEVEKKDDIQG